MVTEAINTQMVLGDGFEPSVTQGPMINDQQLHKVDGLVKDAVEKGAHLLSGGGIHPKLKGRFYEPTVLSNINNTMNIYNEEIFGPVLALYKY